jgi:hypothetical protein
MYFVDYDDNKEHEIFNPQIPRFRPKDVDKTLFTTDEKGNIQVISLRKYNKNRIKMHISTQMLQDRNIIIL